MTLRVRLEIVPHGDETKVREIGRLDIYNCGLAHGICRYEVKDHAGSIYHRRYEGAWELVRKAIDELGITGPPMSPSGDKSECHRTQTR